jgi:hypothetical protein
MYASQLIADAAVFLPQHPRGGSGLQPGEDKPAEGRMAGLIATLRGFLAAHAPGQATSSRSSRTR